MEQMVGEEMRDSLILYLTGVGLVVSSFTFNSWVVRMTALLIAGLGVWMGWIKQTSRFEQTGERLRAGSEKWKAARDENEGMEGMESVYK